MKARELDVRHLDVAAFAEQNAELCGDWPVADLTRLAASAHAEARPAAEDRVRWWARGERREKRATEAEIWLHLRLDAPLRLECQRCLAPVPTDLRVECSLRFVNGEDRAAALDADSEDDVLPLERTLDLQELAEDELLLALPLVPRHEQCPQPLLPASGATDPAGERASPFAVLQGLELDGGRRG